MRVGDELEAIRDCYLSVDGYEHRESGNPTLMVSHLARVKVVAIDSVPKFDHLSKVRLSCPGGNCVLYINSSQPFAQDFFRRVSPLVLLAECFEDEAP